MMALNENRAAPSLTFHEPDWLEWLTTVLCTWFWIYPHPYKLVFTIVLTLPVFGLIYSGLSRPSLASLVSISEQDGKNKYDLADFIEFPGIVILLRVVLDFEYESLYSILKVGAIGFIISLILLGATHKLVEKSNKNKWIIYLSVVGNIALYSYAATYGINCVYDTSKPKVYHAKVIRKSISHGRNYLIHYLRVEPWGPNRETEDIRVSATQYNATDTGHTISIDLKEGLLGIPWYYAE